MGDSTNTILFCILFVDITQSNVRKRDPSRCIGSRELIGPRVCELWPFGGGPVRERCLGTLVGRPSIPQMLVLTNGNSSSYLFFDPGLVIVNIGLSKAVIDQLLS